MSTAAPTKIKYIDSILTGTLGRVCVDLKVVRTVQNIGYVGLRRASTEFLNCVSRKLIETLRCSAHLTVLIIYMPASWSVVLYDYIEYSIIVIIRCTPSTQKRSFLNKTHTFVIASDNNNAIYSPHNDSQRQDTHIPYNK